MAQIGSWDIHPSGHCFHKDGLDAYFGVSEEPAPYLKVIGPYSVVKHQATVPNEVVVKSAMRELVNQLEQELSGSPGLAVFGVTGELAASSEFAIPVMGGDMPFLPNPTLRASLWDQCSKTERAAAYSREWSIDASANRALHRSGIQFQFLQVGRTISVSGDVYAEWGAAVIRNLPSLVLLEVLAEQGFAYIRDFDENRHFDDLQFDPSWFAIESFRSSALVA